MRIVPLVLACALGAPAAAHAGVHTLVFSYHSHAGPSARAYLVVPSWYGPRRHPAIPLVISPHGRGVSGAYNLRFWDSLAARGPFALVVPDGHGRKLPFYSWGWSGQIDDLALMPKLARRAYAWLRIDGSRIYAIGDSMGAQEALLLAASGRIRLAGVAAFDPVTDMAARFRVWAVTPGEMQLPALARVEFGSTPEQSPARYRARSPLARVRSIVRSGVPLQLWWSRRDAVVTDQAEQTERFLARLRAVAPTARVSAVVGYWAHAHAFHANTQLPIALGCFGLIPAKDLTIPASRRLADGSIEELPPESGAPPVPFDRAFCG